MSHTIRQGSHCNQIHFLSDLDCSCRIDYNCSTGLHIKPVAKVQVPNHGSQAWCKVQVSNNGLQVPNYGLQAAYGSLGL